MSLQGYGKKAKLVRWRHQDSTMNANTVLEELLKGLDSDELAGTCVKRCWAPIPYFGDISNSRVATVGINPSNKEFEDNSRNDLAGRKRRFHTLKSLGITSWSEASRCHRQLIVESCTNYFEGNPYITWFKPLNKVIVGTRTSYYNSNACHLDLVPYATTCKWIKLKKQQQSKLLCLNRSLVGQLLSVSPIKVLFLNGQEVVDGFQGAASIQLERQRMDDWTLHYKNGPRYGFAYRGVVSCLPNIPLNRRVLVLGCSHNIQGTFGLNGTVVDSIKDWIATEQLNWKN